MSDTVPAHPALIVRWAKPADAAELALMLREMAQHYRQPSLTEEATLAAREAAEQANRAKSEFVSRMSHELRTPMNSILGFAQVLARKSLPPDQHKHVEHILKAGRHLLKLINEVLDISRIDANRIELSTAPNPIGRRAYDAASPRMNR